jgi:molybdate transport system substrate-binding protein
MTRTSSVASMLIVSCCLLAGCADDDATSATAELTGSVTVSAAASLTDAFERIVDGFKVANPGVEVTFNFDSSSSLSQQIIDGAPADVFASADEANMTKLVDANEIAGAPAVFARNELVIITKPGNPTGITGLADLGSAGVVALCGAEVPCGRFAGQALDTAQVTLPESSITRGQNVRATLAAVAEGDAVAGIVYVTDAEAAGDTVSTVSIPADVNVIATYPIGAVEGSRNPGVAEAFMAYVLGPEGQAALKEFGFLPPA